MSNISALSLIMDEASDLCGDQSCPKQDDNCDIAGVNARATRIVRHLLTKNFREDVKQELHLSNDQAPNISHLEFLSVFAHFFSTLDHLAQLKSKIEGGETLQDKPGLATDMLSIHKDPGTTATQALALTRKTIQWTDIEINTINQTVTALEAGLKFFVRDYKDIIADIYKKALMSIQQNPSSHGCSYLRTIHDNRAIINGLSNGKGVL